MNIHTTLQDPALKRRYNRSLFKTVAPAYQNVTVALSLGRDRFWKKYLISLLPHAVHPVCVDLAAGTGDIAFALEERYPQGKTVGTDLTPAMISVARRRKPQSSVGFSIHDMMCTGIRSGCVDIITGGYALRNAPDLSTTIAEIHRLLTPDGTAAFLDFSHSSNPLLRGIEHAILTIWGSIWGVVFHGDHRVYSYIAHSLQQFPDRKKLGAMFTSAGFSIVHRKLFFFGFLEVLVVKKTKNYE